jgi:replicative DNA helicase
MASASPVATTDIFDRLPPQNLDAERSVLGSILLVNEAIDDVSEFLNASHFYGDAHQRIYAAVMKLHDAGVRGIDNVTLAEELVRSSELEEVGGLPYLAEILESVPHAAHARYYADIVHDKWIQRSLIYACTDILRDSYDPTGSTSELLQSAERSIFQILEGLEQTANFDIGKILIDAWGRINERLASDGTLSGLPTGFADLDAKTNGLQPAELVILASRPSMGKTALACNWAVNVASLAGRGVLFFSLEQSQLELAERFLCIRSQIDGHKLKSGDLDAEERHQLMQVSQELSDMPLFIDDKPGRTVGQIGAIARRFKRQHDIGLVIVDYLQFIEPDDRRAPREQQIALITRRLKNVAKELGIPMIAMAQLNRAVELRDNKRPRLADLRESGAIEQDADLVMFLHRPDAYDPTDHPGLAEVIIAKHRNGPTGIISLTWRAECMRFEDHSSLDEPEGGHFSDRDYGSYDVGF